MVRERSLIGGQANINRKDARQKLRRRVGSEELVAGYVKSGGEKKKVRFVSVPCAKTLSMPMLFIYLRRVWIEKGTRLHECL